MPAMSVFERLTAVSGDGGNSAEPDRALSSINPASVRCLGS